MIKRSLFILVVMILPICLNMFTFNYANAATGLTIQPIKVSKTLELGQVVTGSIRLSNASSEDINVELSIEDFIPTAGTPNISFVGRAEGNTTVKDWITMSGPTSFVFKREEVKDIPYTIKTPPNAEPGSHFGVLFFKATPINEQGQLKVGTRVGVLVFVTVPGNSLQKGKIWDFNAPSFIQGRSVPFTIDFENTGTVHFEPKGNISIKNIFGRNVGMVEVAGQTVLPTGRREIQLDWNAEGLLIGKYVASVTLYDGEGSELTTEDLSFYAFPVKYGLIFVGSILILFFVLRFIRKSVNISITIAK